MHIKIDNNLTRKSNSLMILNEIMKQPLSRTELALKVKLTMGGLTPIIKNMISSGLIEEFKGLSNSNLGRKPILLKINNNKFKIITISISRDKYTISVVNFGNLILKTKEIYYQNKIFTKDELLENISIDIDNIKKDYDIIGLSITAPGPIDYNNGVILNPPNFNGWSNLEIKKNLAKDNFPFSLENDVDAMSYAESYIGEAQNSKKFISLNIGQGVGCGIFINNQNLRKTNRNSCEIGHMSVNIFGEKCNCGNTGCLESYISTNAILNQISISKNKYVNWIEVCSLYKDKDPIVLDIIDRSIKILGHALVSLLNILDLELVVLSGAFSFLGDSIPLELENIISSNLIFKNKNIKVVNSKLKNTETIGSSILFFKEFLQNNDLF